MAAFNLSKILKSTEIPRPKCPTYGVFFYSQTGYRKKVPLVEVVIRLPKLVDFDPKKTNCNRHVILADCDNKCLDSFIKFVEHGEIDGNEEELEKMLDYVYALNEDGDYEVTSNMGKKKTKSPKEAVKAAFKVARSPELVEKVEVVNSSGPQVGSESGKKEVSHCHCGKVCTSQKEYLNHVTTHFRKRILEDVGKDSWCIEGYGFRCKICQAFTKTENGISSHLGSVHGMALNLSPGQGMIKQKPVESMQVKMKRIKGINKISTLASPITPDLSHPPPTPSYVEVEARFLIKHLSMTSFIAGQKC